MLITLYSFSKRKNSTKQPNTGTQVGVNLKNPTSKYNPTFIIGNINPLSYTYLKWEDRYYYIDDIRFIRDHYYELVCSLDVLATYKANVLATTAYVAYSSTNFSTHIVDQRLSTEDTLFYDTESSQLITDGVEVLKQGTYIINYVTSRPTYGGSGLSWMSSSTAEQLLSTLSTEGFKNWLDSFPKQLQGAYDALLSAIAVPFTWYTTPDENAPNIFLAGYDTGIKANRPIPRVVYKTYVTIPWRYTDFRNLAPYTTLLLFLPAYGFVELNPNDYIGKTQITVELTIDGITGHATYIVDKLFRANTSFGVPINIGTIKSNAVGTVGSTLATAGSIGGAIAASLATGGLSVPAAFTTAAAIASQASNTYVSSQQRSVGSIGTNGGSDGIYASIGNWRNVYCMSLSHPTNVEPTVFTNALGRPCNKVLSLASLSGYVQTVGASVSIPNSIHATEVNNLLNGGVYIE